MFEEYVESKQIFPPIYYLINNRNSNGETGIQTDHNR